MPIMMLLLRWVMRLICPCVFLSGRLTVEKDGNGDVCKWIVGVGGGARGGG